MIPVSIRRLNASVSLPEYQTGGAAGFDLAASDDLDVPPNAIALIPTGLVIRYYLYRAPEVIDSWMGRRKPGW